MTSSNLDKMLKPRSMAIVGANDRNNVGARALTNAVKIGFTGPIYVVNPNYEMLQDIKCYPTLASLPENVSFEEGVARLRAALARLEKSEPPIESPAFGKLSYDDKIKMNLRHAELHLSFLHPA